MSIPGHVAWPYGTRYANYNLTCLHIYSGTESGTTVGSIMHLVLHHSYFLAMHMRL